MDDFIEILIFAIIIIANIAGVIKKKQKKKAAELDLPVPTAEEDFFEYDAPDTSEEKDNTLLAAPPSNFPQTTESNAPCPACPAEKSDNFCRFSLPGSPPGSPSGFAAHPPDPWQRNWCTA